MTFLLASGQLLDEVDEPHHHSLAGRQTARDGLSQNAIFSRGIDTLKEGKVQGVTVERESLNTEQDPP